MVRRTGVPRPGVPRLHVVTDDEVLARGDFRDSACAILEAGGPGVALHVRGPSTTGGRLHARVEELLATAGASGALLVVNDRVDVALASGLGAVHLGERSLAVADARRVLGAEVSIGASVHDVAGAATAVAEGSAWLFVGTIFRTPSHPDRPGRGSGFVGEVVGTTGVPVVGIGGITVARTGEVLGAGAHGVAVIRGVWSAADPVAAVHDYLVALERGHARRPNE